MHVAKENSLDTDRVLVCTVLALIYVRTCFYMGVNDPLSGPMQYAFVKFMQAIQPHVFGAFVFTNVTS